MTKSATAGWWPVLSAAAAAAMIMAGAAVVCAAPKAIERACGPPVEQVVLAALQRAGLHPQEEWSWRRRVRWAALLPRFAGRLGESRTSGELMERTTQNALNLNNYLALKWELRATWDLSRLVFDQRELRVASRARQSALQRQQLLEHVVRLYFERCRLLLSEGMPAGNNKEPGLGQALEIQRLTAVLDGLSGGLFSGAAWP